MPISSILSTVQTNYPNGKIVGITSLPDTPYKVRVKSGGETTVAITNPYTGKLLGEYIQEKSPIVLLFKLHYQLLGSDVGEIVVGIVAFCLFMLSITGLLLWNGWNNLWLGFKIKWNAHPMRVNFDLHKVAGIISVVFLTMIAVLGFYWNLTDQSKPILYAATFTPIPTKPVSKVVANRADFLIDAIVEKSNQLFPKADTTFITLPQKPNEVVRIGKQQPGEIDHKFGDTRVYFDRFRCA